MIRRRSLGFVLAALAIVLLYSPALNRVFVADHIIYFAETSTAISLADKIAMADYELVRKYWPGEKRLFRPLLIAGLGTLRHLLGANHRAWNIVNLLEHLMVTLILYVFLKRVAPDGFAGLLALLFGVMRSNAELVTWCHLGGYMLAFASFFAAWSIALDALDGRASRRWLLPCVAALLLAVFTYEPTVAFTIVLVCFLIVSRGRMPAIIPALLLLPVIVFAAAYAVHLRAFPPSGVSTMLPTNIFRSVAVIASSFLVEGALPAAVRIGVEPFERFQIAFDVAMAGPTPALTANAAILIALIALTVPTIGRGLSGRRKAIIVTALLMTLAYMAIITIGRSVDNARENTYYAYLFNLFAIVIFQASVNASRLSLFRRRMLSACMFAYIAFQASLTWNVANAIEDANDPADRYFTELDAIVTPSSKDPNFSFRVDGPSIPGVDPDIILKGEPHRLSRLLYEPWWSDRPQVTLRRQEDMWIRTIEE